MPAIVPLLEAIEGFLHTVTHRSEESVREELNASVAKVLSDADEDDVFTLDEMDSNLTSVVGRAISELEKEHAVVSRSVLSVVQQILEQCESVEEIRLDFTKIRTDGVMEGFLLKSDEQREPAFGFMADMDALETAEARLARLAARVEELERQNGELKAANETLEKEQTLKLRDTKQFRALERILETKNEEIKRLQALASE